MAKKLDDLIIGIQLTTKALEQGMKDVQKKLNSHTAETKRAAKGYDELAVVAGVSFAKIVSSISSGVVAFNNYRNSMIGLKSIADGTGNSFAQSQAFIESFTNDGLIPASNAATALKNLLSRGFSMGEAADILNRFKDAASFGRQAALSLGEAVQSASEGIKNENSILVDNAGVTKNVSIMWKEYAATIGKTADSLTIAEKRQAEYAGIMKETQNQIGDAAKYAKEFSGAQAKAAAETLKLNQAIGGSMVPVLGTVISLFTPLISLTTDLIEQNPILAATIISMVATLAALATGTLAVVSAFKVLKPAIASVTALMATNPILLGVVAGLVALVGITTVVTAKVQKARKEQEAYNTSLAKFNKIKAEGITKSQVPQLEEEVATLQKLVDEHERLTEGMKKYQEEQEKINNHSLEWTEEMGNRSNLYFDMEDGLKKVNAELKAQGVSFEDAKIRIEAYTKAIKEAQKMTIQEYNDQAKIIAQKKVAVMETENLIKTYKNAEKGSSNWNKSQQALAEQFPQFASAAGIEISAIEALTKANNAAIQGEWTALQNKLNIAEKEILANIAIKESILSRLRAEKDLQDMARLPFGNQEGFTGNFVDQAIAEAEKAIADEKAAADVLQKLANTPIENIMGIKPVDYNNEFKAYENTALETALKVHDHRVRMAELTKEEEISSLEEIMNSYAYTADERMDLEERIYQARQELRDRDLQNVQKSIDDEAKKLAERTANSERWISREKNTGNLTGQEEIDAYNRIIKYHKEYLDKIQADTEMAQEDKDRIVAEETAYIQDQQEKIFNIRKDYTQRAVNDYIEAVRKQYDTEEGLENERLNNKLKALNKEYADRETAMRQSERASELESLYAEEKKYQNAATKEGQEKLKSIRAEIASLLKEGEKERLDAEKETKEAAIEKEIADNKEKYKTLRADLETSQRDMLAAASKFAADANTELTNGSNLISKSLSGVIKQFDDNNTTMVKKGLEKLRELINGYKSIMSNVSLNPIAFQTKAPTVGVAGALSAGMSVTINDYGDKNFNTNDEAIDYTKELANTTENALRTVGGKL